MSLRRRRDRQFVLNRTLPKAVAGVLEYFEAVDAASIPKTKRLRNNVGNMTRSSYAVRLTKALMLRKFLELNHDYLCVYEDDVILLEHFESVLEAALLDAPKEWDCFFMGGAHEVAPEGSGEILQCRNTFDNHCVVYSQEGAQKVLSLLTRMPKRSVWSDREIAAAMADGGLVALCPRKFPAWQRGNRSDNAGDRSAGPTLYPKEFRPFMHSDDAHVLFASVQEGDRVLEWGSGGSTLILASRVGDSGHVVSVEHQERWFTSTQHNLRQHGLSSRVTLHHSPPVPDRQEDSPWMYLPRQMDEYVNVPIAQAHIESASVDVVLVDGRERIRCAMLAAELLKSGGLLLIHDFWSRQRYRDHLADLLRFYRYLFETPQSKTGDKQGLAVFVRL